MADDVTLNKAGVVERCIARVQQEHAQNDGADGDIGHRLDGGQVE